MNPYTYCNIIITSITIYKIIKKNPDIIVIYIILQQNINCKIKTHARNRGQELEPFENIVTGTGII